MNKQSRFWFLPNSLSILRIILAFFFPFLDSGFSRVALIVVIGLTDFLDGFLARRLNAISTLGTVLDPIGDKLIALIAAITFFSEGTITFFETVSLFTRDLSLLFFWIFLRWTDSWKNWQIQSFWIGKVVTACQMLIFLLLSAGIFFPSWSYSALGALGILAFGELLMRKQNQPT